MWSLLTSRPHWMLDQGVCVACHSKCYVECEQSDTHGNMEGFLYTKVYFRLLLSFILVSVN